MFKTGTLKITLELSVKFVKLAIVDTTKLLRSRKVPICEPAENTGE